MAIVVGTNSYITEAELTDYATARGITISGTAEVLLIKAMDYLLSLEDRWQGARTDAAQALGWPRTPVYVYGTLIADDAIPQSLKDAQAQLAIEADSQALQVTVAPGGKGSVLREKVDVIEVQYDKGISNSQPIFTAVNGLLKPLFKTTGGGSNFSVTRV